MIGAASLILGLLFTPRDTDGRFAAIEVDHAVYEQTVTDIQHWQARSTTCQDPTLHTLGTRIDSLEDPLNYWWSRINLGPQTHNVAEQYGMWHSDLTLRLADAMVAHCPELADQVYRRVLQMYSGPSFNAVRDRARVGIDDVRWARENASTR